MPFLTVSPGKGLTPKIFDSIPAGMPSIRWVEKDWDSQLKVKATEFLENASCRFQVKNLEKIQWN